MAENKLIFAYWPVQSLGHPIRLLLAYHNIPWEEKSYDLKDREGWFGKAKLELKTPFPNLPYIQDGDLILTETLALIQYAAYKTGQKDLIGKTDLDSIKIYQLWSLSKDVWSLLYGLAKNPDYDKVRDEVLKEKMAPFLDKFAKALGDQDYPLGYLTWADFYCSYVIGIISRMNPDFVTAWPTLLKYHERIFSNEGIQAFRKSEKYPRLFVSEISPWKGEEKI